MAGLLKYCLRSRDKEAYTTSSQALMGVPLQGYDQDGVTVTGPAAWSMGMAHAWHPPHQQAMDTSDGISAHAEPSAPPAEPGETWDESEESYYATFDPKSGGMWMTAKSYRTSFFTQGLKYYCPVSPHRLMVAFSTVDSNRRSSMTMGMPFLSFDLWASSAAGHTKSEGGGMETTPGDLGERMEGSETSVGEYFNALPTKIQDIKGVEDILLASGITEYTRFICGYHIGGIAADQYDSRLCGLDWYAQTTTMRQQNPDVWERYVITDQVCPTQGIYAKAYTKLDRAARWHGHQIGQA